LLDPQRALDVCNTSQKIEQSPEYKKMGKQELAAL